MREQDHGYIEVEEEDFLAWVRDLSDESPFDELFIDERLGVETGPHGE
ncbi:hypothetical protein [Effusibacillus pohliae]|nr:hypothetical protein [Effusibacillus pohliae]